MYADTGPAASSVRRRRRCAGTPARASEARRAASVRLHGTKVDARVSDCQATRLRVRAVRGRALTFLRPRCVRRGRPSSALDGPSVLARTSGDAIRSSSRGLARARLPRRLRRRARATAAGRSSAAPAPVRRSRSSTSTQPRQTSKLYAADGRFIAELGLERRTLVKIDQIPPIVRNAFVITEDKRFYEHAGVDWHRVPGAILRRHQAPQLRRGLLDDHDAARAQHLPRAHLAREDRSCASSRKRRSRARSRRKYSKDKILELYLNQIDLGNGAYGVETASQRYFGKSVRDLNLAEAATLAALPKAPERYNPRRFPERAIQRRNTVIELMREQGDISDADASLAKAYPLQLARKTEAGDVAPYFVEWVRQQLDAAVRQAALRAGPQGLHDARRRPAVRRRARAGEPAARDRGGQVRAVQAHDATSTYIAQRRRARRRAAAANSPYLQGAFVAMDPRTGAVRALVGGRDFDDSKFNRADAGAAPARLDLQADRLRRRRSRTAGRRRTSSTTRRSRCRSRAAADVDAAELRRQVRGPDADAPRRSTSRATSSRSSSAWSSASRASSTMARKFGITTPIPPYPSISHRRGRRLSDRDGLRVLGVRDARHARRAERASCASRISKGDVLWEPTPARTPVLSPEEAWLMVEHDEGRRAARHRGRHASARGFHIPAGGKTGTTNDGTDVWFIGYTPDLVAGVWMGFDRPQKIKAQRAGRRARRAGVDGVHDRGLSPQAGAARLAAPRRHRRRARSTSRPDMLVGPGCRGVRVTEYFIAGTDPTQTCMPSYVRRHHGLDDDPAGLPPIAAGCTAARTRRQPPCDSGDAAARSRQASVADPAPRRDSRVRPVVASPARHDRARRDPPPRGHAPTPRDTSDRVIAPALRRTAP